MIRESIKKEMDRRGWNASNLAENSGVRYPALTQFLNKGKSLAIHNLEMVFKSLGLFLIRKE